MKLKDSFDADLDTLKYFMEKDIQKIAVTIQKPCSSLQN